jgi:hypothetical protein
MNTNAAGHKAALFGLVTLLGILFIGAGIDGKRVVKNVDSKPRLGKTAARDCYLMNINNLILPIMSDGATPDGSIACEGLSEMGYQSRATTVCFAGGFFLSGYSGSTMWANAVASASRVKDFLPGSATLGNSGAGIYILDKNDPAFGDSWQEWKSAVALGADFYDGDGDGIYNPVDKNGNGMHDPDEDAPDILGDVTAWFVINDAVESNRRRWSAVSPQGIDVQRTVFGFRSAGAIGNMLFHRFRIINRGTVANVMDSVFFAVWADPDVGEYTDDLVGSDTTRNAGYTWNDGPDNVFGAEAPTFMVSFFQGPIVPTGNSSDMAFNVRGQLLGIDTVLGATNLGLSSFVNYVQSDPQRGDPANHLEARNYITGHLKDGTNLDPCNDPYGSVFVQPCTEVNPRFWYSGDPPSQYGWLYTTADDMRQMQNIGPFRLEKDVPVDVVVAYVVGRGTSAANSVEVARSVATLSKRVYDGNFEGAPAPPSVRPIVRTTDNTIELIWDTEDQFSFNAQSSVFDYDLRFEGYEVTMYNRNSTAQTEGGRENAKVIARFDKANRFGDILVENPSTGERTIILKKGVQLDTTTYSTPGIGRVKVVIDTDPFTGGPIIKGKPYFLSVTGTAINVRAVVAVDSPRTDAYYLSGGATVQFTQNAASIINSAGGGIRPGMDFNAPWLLQGTPQQISGKSEGVITYEEIDKSALTGNEYEISFFRDSSSTLYKMFWRLRNVTTNAILKDSVADNYRPAEGATPAYTFPVVDGFMARVAGVDPRIRTTSYGPAGNRWYTTFHPDDATGVFYLGNDVTQTGVPTEPPFSTPNRLAKVEKMRRVVIQFGPTQKAYRYVKTATVGQNYIYAAGMPTSGGLDTTQNFRVGYIDVPFRAFISDFRTGERYQVNCAFLETVTSPSRPNGVWDPGTNIGGGTGVGSKEYILIFDTPYSPDTLLQYTGGAPSQPTRWANVITGWDTSGVAELTTAQKLVARDRFLGAIYAVGMQRSSATAFYTPGDSLVIPISYPFSTADAYRFKTNIGGRNLTTADKKSLFSKVNVFPNPLMAYNPGSSYLGRRPDEPYMTFSNLPERVTIKIYTLAGVLLRTLTEVDKWGGPNSPFLEWDLQNDAGLRVASGMYLAIVSAPDLGEEKVLKLAVIMPQKQIQRY